MELQGILSAVATPFDDDGNVDEPRLRRLVDDTIAGGVHGLVPGGSTGEFAYLTDDERRHVLEVTIDQAAGRVPVVGHAAAMTTADALRLAEHAQQSGAAAVMSVAPYYAILEAADAKAYYRAIGAAVDLPVIIYNLPSVTGLNLTAEDIAELANDGSIAYVKDTSGDFHQLTRLVRDYSDVVGTLAGWDTHLLGAFVEGAVGTINGAANFMPRPLVAVWDAVQREDLTAARDEWARLYPMLRFLLAGGSYVAGVKGVMAELGAPIGDPRPPVLPITEPRREALQAVLGSTNIDFIDALVA